MVSVNLTTHISGLASGMDTEKMVSSMMAVNRIPLDKLMQSKTLNTWKTDAYREINTKIASFRSAMEDLRLEGTFASAQKVSSSDPRVSVSMSTKSTHMNFTISGVDMAEPAKAGSVSFGTNFKNGTDLINSDGTITNLSFTLNSKPIEISIDKTTTFDQVIAKINSYSKDTNVTVDNIGGSLLFTTNGEGNGNSITITDVDSNVQDLLGIVNGTTSVESADAIKASASLFTTVPFTDGKDGESGYVVINDTKIIISKNSFIYDGVKINLNQDIPEGSNIPIDIVPDSDKIFDKLKTFVEKYNDLIKDLNDKLSEPVNRKFPPLTDEQRKAMKDDEIKLWEEKAKSGLLSNDPTIRQFLTQIRTSINEAVQGVSGSVGSLKDIGIMTSTNYKENGKLSLDETKLKSALSTNLNAIQELFASKVIDNSKENTITSSEKYAKSGLAVRVYERIGDVIDKLKVIAGAPGTISINSNLAKEAATIDKNMIKVQDRLNVQEQSLWKKFNAMEEALQKLNSQSSWLYQQMGQ
ncbi:flagellar filament capping protein FliD [Neobacillus sp. MM2021_6]|uniref:flagellar filament capping protein FliD n=3 Tax=Bacillaceae TaxID=186817 RepID=UPI001A9458F1|nr:flagellar filament capping protein FliD [Neobacillus sp. MM2021_6]MBO0962795.1 flagellar filament capping protein FliD [Neobacillus sp. MM2021_6]